MRFVFAIDFWIIESNLTKSKDVFATAF